MSTDTTISTIITESDVEQKIIYPILTTEAPYGLGYAISDIRTKADIRKIKIDKGTKSKLYYPDYAIIVNGLPAAIIEAKSPGEDLDEAMREARLYANEINSSYPRNINPCEVVMAANGDDLWIGYWDKDTPEVKIKRCDLDPTIDGFTEFTTLISKKATLNRTGLILKSIKSTTVYVRPTQMLGGKSVANETVGENSFGANVSVEYKYLFNPETLADRASVAQNAYVTSLRKQSHIAPIDKIIRATLPTMSPGRLISNTEHATEIVEKLNDTANLRNEICLLIGSVGSGKSTFTDYLRLEALPKSLRDETLWININLNRAPLSRAEIYKWIVKQCILGLRSLYPEKDFDSLDLIKKIYSVEIGRVERGKASLYPKDSEKYIDVIFSEIDKLQDDDIATLRGMINLLCTGGEKLLIIVLDNCDKRNREDQLLMFDVASWLKEEFTCMVFLPLRDTTYDVYKNEPPLDTVIKDLVFRIDPPLLEQVIYKRMNYALREIQSQKNKFTYYLPNNMKVECAREEVATYLKSMISSLFQDAFFKRIITGLAGRNIRKGLEILLDFCKSGHIGEDELLKSRQSLGDYRLPNHLIAKIILKGKRKYYSDSESHIKNLFSSSVEDELPDPFIRISILTWLKSYSREYGPNRTKGFHKCEALIKALQANGHSEQRALSELTELIRAGCVTSEAQTSTISNHDLISISPAGLVHLDLLKNIDYLSAIAEDVLFRENQPARKIADNMIGKGPFRANSRQSALSTSQTLAEYLTNYHDKFFIGPAKVLNEDQTIDLVGLSLVNDYVARTVDNDVGLKKLNRLESEYPEGTEIDAQVISIQSYGIFVEFGLEGKGLVRKNTQNKRYASASDTIEPGQWVRVCLGKYNAQHNGFNVTLA